MHHDVVQGAIARLFRLGDVYWGPMRGWFCLSCELLWEGAQVADGRCPNSECKREVRWIGTETYLVRATQYQERIREQMRAHPDWLQPADRAERAAAAVPVIIHLIFRVRKRRVEFSTLRFLQAGVEDKCI